MVRSGIAAIALAALFWAAGKIQDLERRLIFIEASYVTKDELQDHEEIPWHLGMDERAKAIEAALERIERKLDTRGGP